MDTCAYVIALFIPTFMSAIGSANLIFFSGLFPLFITFYLGLASSK